MGLIGLGLLAVIGLVASLFNGADAEYVQQRPGYHFTPKENWLNDPNGPMYLNGLYHLFYQCNPNNPWWGDMHWCHAVSTDLLHWEHLPIALYPDQDYDANGVFSGSATILDGGMPVLMYTAVDMNNFQTQAVAYPANISDPFLTNWTKPASNPIIPDNLFPDTIDTQNIRDDTTAWLTNGVWYTLIGARLDYPNTTNVNVSYGGAVLLSSPVYAGLSKWTFERIFHTNNFTGDMWECPDFFPIDRTNSSSLWMFKASMQGYDAWCTFHYHPANQHQLRLASPDVGTSQYQSLDIGWSHYASKSFYDPTIGKQVFFGWLREEDNDAPTRGWASANTLPRVVTLDTDGVSVLLNPHPNLVSLREDSFNATQMQLIPGNPTRIPLIGDQMEIQFSVQLPYPLPTQCLTRVHSPKAVLARYNISVASDVLIYGVNLRTSNDNEEFTPLYFAIDPSALSKEAVLAADPSTPYVASFGFTRTNSSQTNQGSTSSLQGDFKVDRPTGSPSTITFSMQVFVDHSIVEAYLQGGRLRATGRIYPVRADSMFVEVFSDQSVDGEVVSISAWQLLDSMPPPPIE
ncbi:hypothetical protein CAOG_08887 [Capsaspora owczarzaki ATCC 30864]|uniref:Uncharacterized protein n=1 Tax=Capsaspora owczarzaki (strain ATCC 30864) TaxID=595528 RepID=A0A0D2VU21_CAPO3|nr:hypothetical protein CAOG_08887 [Capsaspora owczarzaki ATCC 30864]KJE94857.1 hypothetical protein CAOG_008887 [Capsaspora owczarzaki ATCC 30864]|eukprot:XP_011270549.1 hypothetical protein CAOG_08887 [Capsaspora owczarzaki ATCC 30864]